MLHVLVISLVEHSWNKIKSDYGCPKKKRKDGMPKKHDPKKREKKGVTMSQKKGKKRERQGWFEREKPLPQGVSHIHPSIHPFIHLHLLIEIAWLVSLWILSLTLQHMECKYALFLPYLEPRTLIGRTDALRTPYKCIGQESLINLLSHKHICRYVSCMNPLLVFFYILFLIYRDGISDENLTYKYFMQT